MRRLLLLVLVACAHVAPPSPLVVSVKPQTAAFNAPAPPSPVVVVHALRAASRTPERARVLRDLLGERHGRLEVARGYGGLSLVIDKIVSGALDDPDYPMRPIGVNALPVVLIDEAAHAAPDGLDGFEGDWRLTRRADGSLVASAIRDTPFPPESVDDREASRLRIRTLLQSSSIEDRTAGLDALETRFFYDVVPDVISLLDDPRRETARLPSAHANGFYSPRGVSDAAVMRLRALVAPLGDDAAPFDQKRSSWEAFWSDLLTRPPADPIVLHVQAQPLVEYAMSQQLAELSAGSNGDFAVSLPRLDTPIDGRSAGFFLAPFAGARTWLASTPREAVEIAVGPSVGILSSDQRDDWVFRVALKEHRVAPHATHCALAGSAKEWVLAYLKENKSNVYLQALDGAGLPSGPERVVPLPSPPETHYHRGVHPIAIERKQNGWLATVETSGAILAASLDDRLAPTSIATVSDARGIAQPKLAVAGNNAFVIWTRDGATTRLSYTLVDGSGSRIADIGSIGSEVDAFSTPVALEAGGFAVAWIESVNEVHVGRWTAAGVFGAQSLLQAEDASGPVALSRKGKALVVASEDRSRFPFHLLTRTFDASDLP